MTAFLDELQKTTNRNVRTENNAVTNQSTLNPLLDYFALAGAMRDRPADCQNLFEKAYFTDKQSAVRCLFYLRDIRGGQGERDLFRACLSRLWEIDGPVAVKVLKYVPEYGRWDDLWTVRGMTPEVIEIIKATLVKDEQLKEQGASVSLLAKWLPSSNTSSAKTKTAAKALYKGLGLKESQYRKTVRNLRAWIKLLEQQMSAKAWAEIDYSKLPSQAQRKHTKAFKRHDEERYAAYLAKAVKGEAKMNTATLYTYEVFDTVSENLEAADAMWANLPDYTNGTDAIVLADVSGSMSGRPMSISVSLALYFAEHNKGIFHNCFMTFSESPQVVKVVGNTLAAKLRNIENRDWGYNTNLEKALDAILRAAVKSGQGQDGMPRVLYIISDMEFDECCQNPNETIFDNAEAEFKKAGLELPHIVFWNVNSHQDQVPATKFDNRVTLISGASQSTFRYAVEGKAPEELMLEVINGERYAQIEI